MQEQTRSLYLFNWRITYRADDKREELYTVALDEQGQRLPLVGEEPHSGSMVQMRLDIRRALARCPTRPPGTG